MFIQIVPIVVPIFSSAHLTLKCCLRALDWTVLEQVASVATVVPRVPMQGRSTNLCSSRSNTGLHQSSCQRDPTHVRPLCGFLTHLCLLFVFVPLHFWRSFLPFLAVLFALAFACMSCLPFIVRAGPSTRLVVLRSKSTFSISFTNFVHSIVPAVLINK